MDWGSSQKQMQPSISPCDNRKQEQLPAAPQDLRGGGFQCSHEFYSLLQKKPETVVLSVLFDYSVVQEPEWDVSSAFVANAANNIKLKGQTCRAGQISKENKENETKSGQVF